MKHRIIIMLLLMSSSIFASNITFKTDSLSNLLKSNLSPHQKIKIYRHLADIQLDQPEFKTYLVKLYQEAAKVNDKESMLNALYDIMIENINAENIDSVMKYTEYMKQVATPKELKYLLPYYRMRLFDSLCYSDNKVEDINKELSFLNTDEPNDIYNNIADTYNIGISYYMRQQNEEAKPYIEKAMNLSKSLPDKEKLLYQKFLLRRLCFTYSRIGNNKDAIRLMGNLIQLIEREYKDDYQEQRPFYKIELYLLQYYAFMVSNSFYLTIEQENYYWNKIREIGKTLTNDADRYQYYLCTYYYYSNNRTKIDLPKALAANDTLIRISRSLAIQNVPSLYEQGATLLENIKDYKKALKYLRVSHEIKDSLNTETTSKQLNELQVKYDLNRLNNEKTMLEMKNKQMMIISLTILLVILISISTYFYYSWKKEVRIKLELKRLHSKAQESEKMKQEFINSICHEIRTPLNSIVGFSDLIMNEEIEQEMRREFPAEIQKNTKLLTNLVNSMLEVADLDVSEEKLPCQPTDLINIFVQSMEQLDKKEEIEYKLENMEESLFIPTNASYLKQVIDHLLSNANKFTEKGNITLSYKPDESNKFITIYVTDTGCGIPAEMQEEVFKRFFKLDSFTQGNGLGLYLCLVIVKRLGGEIKIDPDYTAGTRMVVKLPIEETYN